MHAAVRLMQITQQRIRQGIEYYFGHCQIQRHGHLGRFHRGQQPRPRRRSAHECGLGVARRRVVVGMQHNRRIRVGVGSIAHGDEATVTVKHVVGQRGGLQHGAVGVLAPEVSPDVGGRLGVGKEGLQGRFEVPEARRVRAVHLARQVVVGDQYVGVHVAPGHELQRRLAVHGTPGPEAGQAQQQFGAGGHGVVVFDVQHDPLRRPGLPHGPAPNGLIRTNCSPDATTRHRYLSQPHRAMR